MANPTQAEKDADAIAAQNAAANAAAEAQDAASNAAAEARNKAANAAAEGGMSDGKPLKDLRISNDHKSPF
jgi:hypothetical protein